MFWINPLHALWSVKRQYSKENCHDTAMVVDTDCPDLNALRGGEFSIGWSMNRRLWPDADTAGFKLGDPIRIQFLNSSTRLHPMHIHGTFFRVLTVNGKQAAEPFARDTVLVGPRQTIIIGLVPEHQGIWLTHCHIRSYAESGMMTTIQVD